MSGRNTSAGPWPSSVTASVTGGVVARAVHAVSARIENANRTGRMMRVGLGAVSSFDMMWDLGVRVGNGVSEVIGTSKAFPHAIRTAEGAPNPTPIMYIRCMNQPLYLERTTVELMALAF